MSAAADRIALLYDDGAYKETTQRPARAVPGAPMGLMGRQVAGREFLDAYFHHGSWHELVGLVTDRASGQSFREFCQTHPSSRQRRRRIELIQWSRFHERLLTTDPAAHLLHLPSPLDPRFAWARQAAAPHRLALCGVTHTLCSERAVQLLCNLLTSPFESYDALICTSQAVLQMVRTVTDTYAAFLQDRHGGLPRLPLQLEVIPLGVNTERYQPVTAEQRAEQRQRLSIVEDEMVVLFVGRLAHHAKAHPFPMLRALELAAQRTGRRLHLIMAGWAPNAHVEQGYRDAARALAPHVRVSLIDGVDPALRYAVWRAADIFMSLSDNIQETFGLVVAEAMASGLPVVASDWDGYRDLVAPGETGFLVTTRMVRDATGDATARLLSGAINYDHFLAQCSQAVALDVAAAADAVVRLVEDASLRRQMGAAGRERALRQYDWRHIIARYEALWRQQEVRRREAQKSPTPSRWYPGPAAYPAPERSFAGYPSRWCDEGTRLVAAEDAQQRLPVLLELPLTGYKHECRLEDTADASRLLEAARQPQSLGQLLAGLPAPLRGSQAARATVAWLLKYDLLRVVDAGAARAAIAARHPDSSPTGPAQMALITVCKARLENLKRTLPAMVEQPQCQCVVVDSSCPENSGDWVEQNFPQVTVVRVSDGPVLNVAAARNRGASAANAPWLGFIDVDILLAPEFSRTMLPRLRPGRFYTVDPYDEQLQGTCICWRRDYEHVGGYDEVFHGWGVEDDDFYDALRFHRVRQDLLPAALLYHLPHDDASRTRYRGISDRMLSREINRLYRAVKWDLARLWHKPPSLDQRRRLHQQAGRLVRQAWEQDQVGHLELDMGRAEWGGEGQWIVHRLLRYVLDHSPSR